MEGSPLWMLGIKVGLDVVRSTRSTRQGRLGCLNPSWATSATRARFRTPKSSCSTGIRMASPPPSSSACLVRANHSSGDFDAL
eukprot:769377-Rhodomonas_salina.3